MLMKKGLDSETRDPIVSDRERALARVAVIGKAQGAPNKLGYNSRSFSIGQSVLFLRTGEGSPGKSTAGGIMTDIGRHEHVAAAQAQISVRSYFDALLIDNDNELIFYQTSLYAFLASQDTDPLVCRTVS